MTLLKLVESLMFHFLSDNASKQAFHDRGGKQPTHSNILARLFISPDISHVLA